MSRRRAIGRTFVAKVLVAGLGGVTSIVLARSLGPEGRGAYALPVAYASAAALIGHLSVEQAQVQGWTDEARRRAISAAAPLLGVANGAVATVVALALAPLVVGGIDAALVWALVGVIPSVVVLYAFSVRALRGDNGRVNAVRVAGAALQLGAAAVLALTGTLTVTRVVVVWSLVMLVQAIPLVAGLGGPRSVRRDELRVLETGGLRYHLGSVSTWLLWRVDILLLGALAGERETGIYTLAVTAAELVYLVTESVAQVMLPSQVHPDDDEARAASARVVRVTIVVAVLMATAIASTAPWTVPFVYGEEFRPSATAVAALVPGVVALAALKPIGVLLLRARRPYLVSAMAVAALAVNVVANLLLIDPLGATGAAIASTTAYWLLGGLYVLAARRLCGLSVREVVPRWADVRQLWHRSPPGGTAPPLGTA